MNVARPPPPYPGKAAQLVFLDRLFMCFAAMLGGRCVQAMAGTESRRAGSGDAFWVMFRASLRVCVVWSVAPCWAVL